LGPLATESPCIISILLCLVQLHSWTPYVHTGTISLKTQKFYILSTEYLYHLYVPQKKNIEVFPIPPSTTGFYNRWSKCLLRSTSWAFKWNGL